MQLSFENLLVEIQQQGNDVKVLIDSNSTLLMNQDVQQVAEQLRSNFDIVFSNYLNLANASEEEMNKVKLSPSHQIDYERIQVEIEEYFEILMKAFYK